MDISGHDDTQESVLLLHIENMITLLLLYTRGITPKRVTNSKVHLHGFAPGQNSSDSSEGTSQRWRLPPIRSDDLRTVSDVFNH